MSIRRTPLAVVILGAAAGLAGTAVITGAMMVVPELMEAAGLSLPRPERPLTRRAYEPGPDTPTQELAQRVSEGVLEKPLPEKAKVMAGEAVHWGYGAAWGALYGILAGSLPMPRRLGGILLGGLVAITASILVPAMGVMPPPERQPASLNVMMLGNHLLYGLVTAQTFRFLAGR